MEYSDEIKAKVFAQYLGCEFIYSGTKDELRCTLDIGNLNTMAEDKDFSECKLILKKLEDITDVDKKLLVNFFEKRTGTIKDVSIQDGWLCFNKKLQYSYTTSKFKLDESMNCMAYQFLQSKCYDIPNFYLDGKTPIEAGIAVDEKTLASTNFKVINKENDVTIHNMITNTTNSKSGSICIFKDRDDLIRFIKGFIDEPTVGMSVLMLMTSCGCGADYQTFEDLPHESTFCEHGQPFVQYKSIL